MDMVCQDGLQSNHRGAIRSEELARIAVFPGYRCKYRSPGIIVTNKDHGWRWESRSVGKFESSGTVHRWGTSTVSARWGDLVLVLLVSQRENHVMPSRQRKSVHSHGTHYQLTSLSWSLRDLKALRFAADLSTRWFAGMRFSKAAPLVSNQIPHPHPWVLLLLSVGSGSVEAS